VIEQKESRGESGASHERLHTYPWIATQQHHY